jgi:hypothetical protein
MAFWRGVARAERCLIDRQMPIEGDYYGSGILVRERVELAVKARGVGGCRCSSGEFLRGSMCFDRREIIAVDIGRGSRGSEFGRGKEQGEVNRRGVIDVL